MRMSRRLQNNCLGAELARMGERLNLCYLGACRSRIRVCAEALAPEQAQLRYADATAGGRRKLLVRQSPCAGLHSLHMLT